MPTRSGPFDRLRERTVRLRERVAGSGNEMGILLGMGYDVELAQRLREIVGEQGAYEEKAMFGGLAFLVGGHMAVAAGREGGLLLRVPPERTEALAAEPGAGRFVMRGREMVGWLRVQVDAGTPEDVLRRWVGLGLGHVRTLPAR